MESVQLEMSVGENEPKRFDFKHRKVLREDPLVSAAASVLPASGLTVGACTISGTEVQTKLTATLAGTYRITFSGTTSANAYVVIGYADVTVTTPPGP